MCFYLIFPLQIVKTVCFWQQATGSPNFQYALVNDCKVLSWVSMLKSAENRLCSIWPACFQSNQLNEFVKNRLLQYCKLMWLGLTNWIVDHLDSKLIYWDRQFRSDSKSTNVFESTIAISIYNQSIFDILPIKIDPFDLLLIKRSI